MKNLSKLHKKLAQTAWKTFERCLLSNVENAFWCQRKLQLFHQDLHGEFIKFAQQMTLKWIQNMMIMQQIQ